MHAAFSNTSKSLPHQLCCQTACCSGKSFVANSDSSYSAFVTFLTSLSQHALYHNS